MEEWRVSLRDLRKGFKVKTSSPPFQGAGARPASCSADASGRVARTAGGSRGSAESGRGAAARARGAAADPVGRGGDAVRAATPRRPRRRRGGRGDAAQIRWPQALTPSTAAGGHQFCLDVYLDGWGDDDRDCTAVFVRFAGKSGRVRGVATVGLAGPPRGDDAATRLRDAAGAFLDVP